MQASRQLRKADGSKVQVFCRIQPLASATATASGQPSNPSCVRVEDDSKTVVLVSSENNAKKETIFFETKYLCDDVFQADASQEQVFAKVGRPLIENLIKGKNGLLFTYGVTGSGKTYTMTGCDNDKEHKVGIMPRCLDHLFRIIGSYQTERNAFQTDHLNGFEFSAAKELKSKAKLSGALESKNKNNFAVFISYIEVYNNGVFDLLDAFNSQCKIVREDAHHIMFVHGVIEIEVKSMDEAIEVLQVGHKRKRRACTALNSSSSRSHSVLNIRLVQAPRHCFKNVSERMKRLITVSQLSLVDLAGSERSSRTKNTGLRLREAGNINNSLMTLRKCFKYLRENQNCQKWGEAQKKMPYRDSKITLLFKNYFEGDGRTVMIVCINPRWEDYHENTHVMEFAEMTQGIRIVRKVAAKTNAMLKMQNIADDEIGNEASHDKPSKDIDLVFKLREHEIKHAEYGSFLDKIKDALVRRREARKAMQLNMDKRLNELSKRIQHLDEVNAVYCAEMQAMQPGCNNRADRCQNPKQKLATCEGMAKDNHKLSAKLKGAVSALTLASEIPDTAGHMVVGDVKPKPRTKPNLMRSQSSKELELGLSSTKSLAQRKRERVALPLAEISYTPTQVCPGSLSTAEERPIESKEIGSENCATKECVNFENDCEQISNINSIHSPRSKELEYKLAPPKRQQPALQQQNQKFNTLPSAEVYYTPTQLRRIHHRSLTATAARSVPYESQVISETEDTSHSAYAGDDENFENYLGNINVTKLIRSPLFDNSPDISFKSLKM